MQVRIDNVGNERAPVIVIDDAWPDAKALHALAAQRTDYERTSLYYPGLRSVAPREYAIGMVAALSDVIRSTLGIVGELTITDSTFSLVTIAAE